MTFKAYDNSLVTECERTLSLVFDSPEEFKNKAVRRNKGGKLEYYFDKNGIYRCRKPKTICIDEMYLPRIKVLQPKLPKYVNGVVINMNWIIVILKTLKIDEDTIDDLIERYNYIIDNINEDVKVTEILYKKYPRLRDDKTSITEKILKNKAIPEEVRNFIYKIDKPIFERDADNPKNNTFDFIRIFVSIPSEEKMPDRVKFVKEHRREIAGMVLERIERDKSFEKYNVPINILKLEAFTITRTSELMLLFGIKTV